MEKAKKTGIDYNDVAEKQHVLPKRKSRKSNCSCKYYTDIPEDMESSVLCSGVDLWARCPEYDKCAAKPKKKPVPAKSGDTYYRKSWK